MSVSEWADERRQLSSEASAEPGRWRTDRAEYQRGIMDAVTDPTVSEIVCKKGTQIGWTEIVNNVVGYFMDLDPSPILIIQPTVELAKSWSKERLAPMLRDTPALVGKVREARSRDSKNTVLHKEFDGGHLTAVGANAPSGLASRPIRIVLNDETDRYPVSAGTEGDPQKLASKRQQTFWNRKTLKGSAPVLKEISPITRDYELSDKRRFFVPCAHCGTFQSLSWQQVKWDKRKDNNDKTLEHFPDTAHYQCEHCGELWTDAERWKSVEQGEWRATAPFTGVAGFHLSQFYSPWVKLREVVKEFLEAQGRPELLQIWTNTVLGEPWEEKRETVDAAGLKSHIEDYEPYELPDGVLFAVAGIDVQDDRLEIEVVAYGEADETWGVLHDVLYGDPSQATVWANVEELLFDRYWTASGRLVKVRATCVDYGGHHGQQVSAFAEKHKRRRVYATKGVAGPRLIWPKRATRGKHTNSLRLIGVDTAKDSIYGRYKIENPGPGYCHLPPSYDDEWFDQATVEYVVTRYREGRPYRVWVCPKGKRNEALDLRVLAHAARMSLGNRQIQPSKVVAETIEAREVVAQRETDAGQTKRGRRVRSRGIRR